jgi:hypothetical protein
MYPSRPALALLVLASLLPLTGCGEDDAGSAAETVLEGPMRWRLAREGLPEAGVAVSLQVRTPMRVRLRLKGTEQMTTPVAWRELPAGRTLKLTWAHATPTDKGVEARPGAEDHRAGRTETHWIHVDYHFGDEAVTQRQLLAWTRPGRGTVKASEVLPPGKYEPMPLKGTVELVSIIIADLGEGTATLQRRGPRTTLRAPKPLAPGDRIRRVRLFLDFEPLPE